jgi:predicted molibdopterin-dependent oxidoreductase YjgC
VFGAGGGTSSYEETRSADLIVLWGSNAREAHPIFFHHVLKAVNAGAQLMVVDPRRTPSAQWADLWLGLDVGTDIPLANAVGREIIAAGLADLEFIERATTGFGAYRESVEPWTLEEGERVTGVPADAIRDLAHAYGRAENAQLCWTLGITEHHNAVDNVFALINLALLTGKVGKWGSGLQPLRGQNNVQGGGDMGAIPNKLPGFQEILDDGIRAKFDAAWGSSMPSQPGLHLTGMFEAMEHGELRAVYVVGENPAQGEADQARAERLLTGLDHLVVQDIFLTRTAQLADVVLPAAATLGEAEGTVTSSERRVQRVRRAYDAPGEARDDIEIVYELARRLGYDLGSAKAADVWNELRSLSPMHAGMSYERLEELGGIQWPCVDEDDPGALFIHGRLWDEVVEDRAPFNAVEHDPPVDTLDDDFPLRLTTGRRLESYNTGVQTGGYSSPLHVGGTDILLSPADGERYGVADGARVRIVSRRGAVETSARYDPNLRAGLAFMNLHFPDVVATNMLTIDATDPRSGTAEFKATAIRLEPVA